MPALGRRLGDPIRTLVFFGFFYLYVWLSVQSCLIYSCGTVTNFPVFYRGWAFFNDTALLPGGLTRYVSAFLSQLLEYSWAGALVVTAQAWAISACTGCLLRVAGLPAGRLLRFVPALLVLASYARYSYHLPLFMGAIASLASVCLYVKLASRGEPGNTGKVCLRDILLFLVLSVISYLAAAAAFVPFAVLCAVYELRRRRRLQLGLCLLIGGVLPYVLGVLAFRISLVNAYTELLPMSWRVLDWATRDKMLAAVYGVYAFAFLGLLAGGAWAALTARRSAPEPADQPARKPAKGRPTTTAKPRTNGLVRWARTPAVRWTFGSLVLLAAGGAVAAFAPDAREKASLEVHHYACRRMWPQVLAAARRCPDSIHVMSAVNLALYHTGRLTTDMFSYVQQPAGLLLTGERHAMLYWHAFDALIDLGLANLAEKNLAECMETFGEHPLILERLATVNLIKGRNEAAKIYLGALQRTLLHRKWAGGLLSRLDADPNLPGDSEIRRLRAQCLRKDSIAQFYAEAPMLTALVEQGSGNRMAFEYLLASYLLNGQLAKVAEQIGRLDEFGYTEIPPLCQEAILIYAYGTGKAVDLHGRMISAESDQRFKHFSSIAKRHGNDHAAAVAELARDYRGSYFFYFFCTKVANR